MEHVHRSRLAAADLAALDAAETAASFARAPYSRFRVGAALATGDGDIVVGCNVESASYGLTVCAERTAVFAAVARGISGFVTVAVWTPTDAPTMPCGACRQVLHELAPGVRVLSGCNSDQVAVTTIDELLPEAFPDDSFPEA